MTNNTQDTWTITQELVAQGIDPEQALKLAMSKTGLEPTAPRV